MNHISVVILLYDLCQSCSLLFGGIFCCWV